MLKYDAVVVGGGPIGSYAAKNIACEGFKVALFEEHRQVGIPLKCAGLVTSRVFDFFDCPKEEIIQNEIQGAHIHSPSGNILTIGGDKIHALVINRTRFDTETIKQASKAGAEIFLENKVIAAKRNTKAIQLNTLQKENIKQITCDLVIGADGPNSLIRNTFQLPKPVEILRGMGAEITHASLNPKFVEIFLGRDIAPGFFAWIIPTNNKGTEARVGLCINQSSKHSVKHYFNNLFENPVAKSYLHDAEITKNIAGMIPLGLMKKTTDKNVMLVGDAATQVKPTSGGGIYTGLLCARYCSSVAVEALNKKIYTAQLLKKYHKTWSNAIGREIMLGMKFRKIFRKLNDRQIDRYVEKLNNKKIIDTINEFGDIDYPSKLVMPLIKKSPSLLKLALNI